MNAVGNACPDDETLAAFVARRGSDPRRIEAHLDGCSSCRQLVAHLAPNAIGTTETSPATRIDPPVTDGPIEKGTRIDRYVVERELGRGGMGVVLAGYDPELHRPVALKLVRPDDDDPSAATRLVREARAMARLAHPNVVTIFDVGEHVDGQVFLAMELVEGSSLRVVLAQPRPLARTLDLFVQAGRGLAAAHAAGLVHRDFKPDNVLVGRDGRVRVTDFGLVRGSSEGEGGAMTLASGRPLTASGGLLGTPAYMAPEQHIGVRALAPADQFAFAVALYEGIVGYRPFPGPDYASLRDAKLRERRLEWPPQVNVPEEVRLAVDRALSRDPERRHPAMNDLVVVLERALRRLEIDAPAPSPDTITASAPPTVAAPPAVGALMRAAPPAPPAPVRFAPHAPLPPPPRTSPVTGPIVVVLAILVVAVIYGAGFALSKLRGSASEIPSPATRTGSVDPMPPVVPAFKPVVASPSRTSKLPCPPGTTQLSEETFISCVDAGGHSEGPSLSFHPNGRLSEQVFYAADRKTGHLFELSADGRVTVIAEYKVGNVHGLRLELHANGKVWKAQEYADGELDGVSREWAEDGRLVAWRRHAEGQMIEGRTF